MITTTEVRMREMVAPVRIDFFFIHKPHQFAQPDGGGCGWSTWPDEWPI
ncbi:hypothetical protein V474_15660 [Novosphingobium barchaimii LL02]|uniref:Uncharacterized protein n=1 Tax=Novosphingobium barchaimii LL02 TaxID=1114963 RepID=A0A0J7XYB6_9SPHN|nr:hypothetical protein V474_15660 [Novosphingobium barchaimii LL02]